MVHLWGRGPVVTGQVSRDEAFHSHLVLRHTQAPHSNGFWPNRQLLGRRRKFPHASRLARSLSRLNSLLRDLALQHCPSPPAAQVQVQSRLIMDKFSGDGSGDSGGGRRKWEEDSRECY